MAVGLGKRRAWPSQEEVEARGLQAETCWQGGCGDCARLAPWDLLSAPSLSAVILSHWGNTHTAVPAPPAKPQIPVAIDLLQVAPRYP